MANPLSLNDTDVLIVGAGPTRLVFALWLTRLGINVRILDKTAEPGTTSRALAVQARTLEFYGQLGFANVVVEQGRWATKVNIWANGKPAAQVDFSGMGAGISPYPYPLLYPQDEHERLLVERLQEAGIAVERKTEMVLFEEAEDCIRAKIKKLDGTEENCTAAYVAGCDGARSRVREMLGIGFPGGTYEHLFYVADVEASGPVLNGDLNIALERSDFLGVFRMKDERRARFIGTVHASKQPDEKLTWDDVNKGVIEHLRTSVTGVNWFSTYHVHHRVADHFRKGRAFLLGDAAHIHSPVGGQGMNTGIGDAANLAWKLAAVVRGRAKASLLDTYEPERIAFARKLVATTDRAFTAVTSSSSLARTIRLRIAPILAALMFSFRAVRRRLFRTISQVAVNYRGSSLSQGRAGTVHGGERLPWVRMDSEATCTDNFAALTSLDWQIHIYGQASPTLQAVCTQRKLALHVFPWQSRMSTAGLRRNSLYLVRPDGYIALADAEANAASVASYLDERGIVLMK
jgi:2-polyprenyl-6-methoxyphenol hydroxylase-like FAD-dependent oxidoreductase